MATANSIRTIDITPLFGSRSRARDAVDRSVMAAAAVSGFVTITGLPAEIRPDATIRRQLLRLFDAPQEVLESLSWNRSDPSRSLLYRGWFGLKEGRAYYNEGMELGPDIAHGECVLDAVDPLKRPTPMPSEAALPGWRSVVRDYWLGMESVGDAVLRAIARGLDVSEDRLSQLFLGGISSLRLLRYPVRPPSACAGVPEDRLYVMHNGVRREVINEAHVDFGFLTLLAQDEADGLQAKMPDGTWLDVPPVDGHLVVNFGKLLERWTAGRIRATEHRVLSPGRERFSLPFFYEPRVDAEIKPLPLTDAGQFSPFLYGDHVWAAHPKFLRLFGERVSRPTPL